jgi:hypothetical protein
MKDKLLQSNLTVILTIEYEVIALLNMFLTSSVKCEKITAESGLSLGHPLVTTFAKDFQASTMPGPS